MLKPLDVAYWHFSEVAALMDDVGWWRKTGSGQRWGEPKRLTHNGHSKVTLAADTTVAAALD